MNNTKLFFLAHDGITSLYTGVGKVANQSIDVICDKSRKFNITPYFATGRYTDKCLGFNSKIHAETLNKAVSCGGELVEINNGSDGSISYGDINNWKIVTNNAVALINNLLNHGDKAIIIALDTPFAGISLECVNKLKIDNYIVIWIPHSTAAIHKVDSAIGNHGAGDKYYQTRYEWEKSAIDASKNNEHCFVGAIGKFMKQHLIDEYQADSKKLCDFTNGIKIVDTKKYTDGEISILFQKNNIDLNKKIVLTFGRLEKYKGFEEAVLLSKHFSDDLQLVIFAQPYQSTDPYLNHFIEFTKNNNPKVEFIYDYNFNDPHVFMCSDMVKIVLVPSVAEPFGLIPEEVRLTKLPIIPVVNNTGGLPEQITNNVNGYVIDITDTVKSSELISNVSKLSQEEVERIVTHGFDKLKNNYNLEDNLTNSLNILLTKLK